MDLVDMTKAKGPLYRVHFRRARDGRTDYGKRLSLLKSRKARLVFRKTSNYVIVQVVQFESNGDRTVAAASSKDLKKFGFNGKCNTPSAYLTGLLCGRKAVGKKTADIILDIGLNASSKGGLAYAALKGALDAGLKTNYSEEVLPSEERIAGKHLSEEVQKQFEGAKKKILE